MSDESQWYWKTVAFSASWMILGGFLTLTPTFDTDADLRVNGTSLSIFSVALLIAGFTITGLLSLACRDWIFRADSIYLPALSSSFLGLLTVFYSFLISTRYKWNTASLLITIFSALSTITYGALLLWAYRKIALARARPRSPSTVPLQRGYHSSIGSLPIGTASPYDQSTWQTPNPNPTPPQDSPYYQGNYGANNYQTPERPSESTQRGMPPDTVLTEEDLTRQQMLMLLHRPEPTMPSPDPGSGSFNRIDWTAQEEAGISSPRTAVSERPPPFYGYYAPSPQQQQPQPQQQQQQYNSSHATQTPVSSGAGLDHSPSYGAYTLSATGGSYRPWDGVWRTPVEAHPPEAVHPAFRDARFVGQAMSREERRREIENGR